MDLLPENSEISLSFPNTEDTDMGAG
jgi:hypothetical protein